MFFYCYSLISLPDMSKWNTDKVDSIEAMFYKCMSLKSLPGISKWNTKNVKNSDIFLVLIFSKLKFSK